MWVPGAQTAGQQDSQGLGRPGPGAGSASLRGLHGFEQAVFALI